MFGVVETAGAFGKGNVRYAMLAKIMHNSLYHKRMGSHREVRAFGHDKVGFDHDLKTGMQVIGNG